MATMGGILLQDLLNGSEDNTISGGLHDPDMAHGVAVDQQMKDHDEFLVEIWDRLLQVQVHMKEQLDQLRRDIEFTMGQWVWLRLHHRVATSIAEHGYSKLTLKHYGHFEVLERIGTVAYRLLAIASQNSHSQCLSCLALEGQSR